MIYFVTGASGFIGKRLVRRLLSHPDSVVYFLTLDASETAVESLRKFWDSDPVRAIPVAGDLTQPSMGIDDDTLSALEARIDHFFHLAAIYDLTADPKAVMAANVGGTRNAVQVAERIGARRFHLVSSIAAAGLYKGVFREDMFKEATHLEHPYFASKHESEAIVRTECPVPWRIYRPGSVVGDSRTGDMEKIDGPYYFFKLIQQIRNVLPQWVPMLGIEGGRINIVPVDFVVAALDHIAHTEGQDGKCFHLTDPSPLRVGEVLNVFARAAHAPQMKARVNAALLGMIPQGFVRTLLALTPVRRMRGLATEQLGLPDGILNLINYPTRFDSREAQALLEPAGITVPRLESYAWRLWDYWERHLDPDLHIDRSLHGRVAGRVVLITGGSAGIGRAAALRLAQVGATVLIAARDPVKLSATQRDAEAQGLRLFTYEADIADAGQCASLIAAVQAEYGGVDILINNAGHSIRRAIENSYDRMHDFERLMRLNYFGAVQLTMGLLPVMVKRRAGHVINISSLGVLASAPRFSAYVASKAALEAWTRCAAAEYLDQGVAFTIVNMPLVRTAMISPTDAYDNAAALSPDAAAEMIVKAVVQRPARVTTGLGTFATIVSEFAPKLGQIILNTAYHMFPESAASKGEDRKRAAPTAEQLIVAQLLPGFHL